MATKGCLQLTSNETYFDDSWFSVVKTAEEAIALGVNYCGLVKMSHNGFCLDTLEKLDEILAWRIISCYEYYSNISWW